MKKLSSYFGWAMLAFGVFMITITVVLITTDTSGKVRISPFYFIFLFLVLLVGGLSLYYSRQLKE